MTFEIKVCKYSDVVPFSDVKITRYDLSKQKQKKPLKLIIETQTFKEESQ